MNLVERQVASQFLAEEHHTSHPEEENVMSRLQQRRRVEALHVGRLIWPAHRREGEERR